MHLKAKRSAQNNIAMPWFCFLFGVLIHKVSFPIDALSPSQRIADVVQQPSMGGVELTAKTRSVGKLNTDMQAAKFDFIFQYSSFTTAIHNPKPDDRWEIRIISFKCTILVLSRTTPHDIKSNLCKFKMKSLVAKNVKQ